MSGKGIHVHGPHDHEVEHPGHQGGLGQRIAIFTAVLATVRAVVSYDGGPPRNEALRYKNQAVRENAEASSPWNRHRALRTEPDRVGLAANGIAALGGVAVGIVAGF